MLKELTKDNIEIIQKFHELKCIKDIALLLEVDINTLVWHSFHKTKSQQYTSFYIPKRSGGFREIHSPIIGLKILQKKINHILSLTTNPRGSVFGFVPKKNIYQNAKMHTLSAWVLRIDLEDFFGQVNFGRVRGLFQSYPFTFNNEVATTLANLLCFNNSLPQGAPTSPIISNIICWQLDKELEYLCRINNCRYTRYADDITISSKKSALPESILHPDYTLGDTILRIFDKNGFKLNFNKLRVSFPGVRQMVTGLIVNNEEPNVPRDYIRKIRAQLNYCEKHVVAQKALPISINTLSGELAFAKSIRGSKDLLVIKYMKWLNYIQLQDTWNKLLLTKNSQKKGSGLEKLFNILCKANDISILEPFTRNDGAEQIDGFISLKSGQHMLVECKYTNNTSGLNVAIPAFSMKGQLSGNGTYCLFISMAGWGKHTVKTVKQYKDKNMLLMKKEDLESVIKHRNLDFQIVLEEMIKHYKSKGEPYLPIDNYIKSTF